MNDNKQVELSALVPPSETQKTSARKPYNSPNLREWGTIADLTQGDGGAFAETTGGNQFSTKAFAPRRR